MVPQKFHVLHALVPSVTCARATVGLHRLVTRCGAAFLTAFLGVFELYILLALDLLLSWRSASC